MRKRRKKGIFRNLKRLLELLSLARKHKVLKYSRKVKKQISNGLSPREIFSGSKNLEDLGKGLRLFFQDAGPTFIKFGQILSLQVDVLPKEIYSELENLQDNVPKFSFDFVKETLERELRMPMEKVFSSFSEEPFAAASLAQVHKAKLISGENVAVKVKRPQIEKIIEKDLSLLKFILKFINLKKLNLDEEHLARVIKEFEDALFIELHFEIEARNMNKIREILGTSVLIPKAYPKLTTSDILIMDFVDSVKITDLKKIEALGLKKDRVIKSVVETYLRQIFVYGLYHGDPHPANIGVNKQGKIVIYDFGVIGSLSKEYRESLKKMVNFMMNLDSVGYLEEFLKSNRLDREEFPFDQIVEEIDEILEGYNKSIIPDFSQCLAALAKILNNHGIRDSHRYIVLTRTMLVLTSITKIYGMTDRGVLEIFSKVSGEVLRKDLISSFSLGRISEKIDTINRTAESLIRDPKSFLQRNLPGIKLEGKKKKEVPRGVDAKYRSFGIYKFPFFCFLFVFAGFLVMKFYPTLALKGYALSWILFSISGFIFVVFLIYLVFLDYHLDSRVEVFKYPFFMTFFATLGFGFSFFFPEVIFLGYKGSYYFFGISFLFLLLSVFQIFRIFFNMFREKLEEAYSF
jgi:predicted unusual protein kinase regulating ubiquinone biosynthesis (AarF/ABC1/UbiB family)